jgi:hypothetical protein
MRDPEFVKRFMAETSYQRLAWFFLKHPPRALNAVETRLSEAGRQRPPRGNFDLGAGQPPYAESQSFGVWSRLKAGIFNGHGGRYLLYALCLPVLATLLAIAQRGTLPSGIPEGVSILSVAYLTALSVGALADALDAARHFLLFSAVGDVLLVASLYLGVVAFSR